MDLSPPPLSRIALDRWIALRFPGVRTVTTDELARRLAAGAPDAPVLVDVRADDERAVSVIPGAFGARDADDAVHRLAAFDRSLPVVVYCSVGVRSARAAAALADAGHRDVRNLAGGVFAWANEGRPLACASGPASFVHPYDTRWGRLLRAYLRASAGAAR